MPKMKPKWMTETVWALRRAKREGRLPEETELLFLGEPELCFRYSKAIRARLPENLEESVCACLEGEQSVWATAIRKACGSSSSNLQDPYQDKTVVNWIISYMQSVGEITPRMQKIIVTRIKGHVGSSYDWGFERALKYASLCNNEIPEGLEETIWSHECAFNYAMHSGKRIPPGLEPEIISKFLDDDEVVSYSRKIFNGRLPPELERLLADMPDAALAYAREIIIGKLPEELHTAMIMKSFENNNEFKRIISQYLDFVKLTYNHTRSTLANFDKNATVEEVLKSIEEECPSPELQK